MSVTLAHKIEQDIVLLQLCLENRFLINKQKNKVYKEDFWNQIHKEYNSSFPKTPKNIKQLRDRFRYLYKNFSRSHSFDVKLNKNIYKGDFMKKHKALVNEYAELVDYCFHKITYTNSNVLTLADDFCIFCYKKRFPNLTEEDFKQVNEPKVTETLNDNQKECMSERHVTYTSVYNQELNKIFKTITDEQIRTWSNNTFDLDDFADPTFFRR
ncbi:unnamed protein product [Hanseniaspora opuntiae]